IRCERRTVYPFLVDNDQAIRLMLRELNRSSNGSLEPKTPTFCGASKVHSWETQNSAQETRLKCEP
ncbi:hypothetical protein, partial [Thioclava indica]|uniref:hypothetical protein n=1 Tax=Thioclava indica TaxID=1353528 RepID=UPI00196A14B0